MFFSCIGSNCTCSLLCSTCILSKPSNTKIPPLMEHATQKEKNRRYKKFTFIPRFWIKWGVCCMFTTWKYFEKRPVAPDSPPKEVLTCCDLQGTEVDTKQPFVGNTVWSVASSNWQGPRACTPWGPPPPHLSYFCIVHKVDLNQRIKYTSESLGYISTIWGDICSGLFQLVLILRGGFKRTNSWQRYLPIERMRTVSVIDPERYLGLWYEFAAIPSEICKLVAQQLQPNTLFWRGHDRSSQRMPPR